MSARIQLTALSLGLGVPPAKCLAVFVAGLKQLGHDSGLSPRDLSRVRAKLECWSDNYADGWAKGYTEGWAEAVLRALDERDISCSDEIAAYITACSDLRTLARWLDLAATVTDVRDLFAKPPEGVPPSGA
ncbi:hypothetical protein [Streptomyces apocyni]|uniref:hypothetical protein n=1 Tax=Streptomyces apocyni TaxID=2654677 RepID=UPI0012EAE19F|nr:hypothetical protein [Streptomyces apocyni]